MQLTLSLSLGGRHRAVLPRRPVAVRGSVKMVLSPVITHEQPHSRSRSQHRNHPAASGRTISDLIKQCSCPARAGTTSQQRSTLPAASRGTVFVRLETQCSKVLTCRPAASYESASQPTRQLLLARLSRFWGNVCSMRRVGMILPGMRGSIGGCLVTLLKESAADAPVRKPTGVADARAGAVRAVFQLTFVYDVHDAGRGAGCPAGGRTVCGMLTGAGLARVWHHSRGAPVLRRGGVERR